MAAKVKAPTTVQASGAFKTNLSLNFKRATHTYNAITFMVKRVAVDALPVLVFYGVCLACLLLGGVK